MNIKRTLCVVLLFILCVCLVGCSFEMPTQQVTVDEPAAAPDTEGEKTEAPDPFADIIALYSSAVSAGWDAEQMQKNGLNPLIPACIAQDERAKVGYFVGDLNGDGKEELAISSKSESVAYTGFLFALYELRDGKASLLVESAERDRWYFAGEGKLYNEASSSAAVSCYSVCTMDFELSFLDALEYNADERPDEPWLRFTGETWEHITGEQADEALLEISYLIENLDIIPFDY